MGEYDDNTAETVQEEPTGSGTTATEESQGIVGESEPTGNLGESDGRGSGDVGGDSDGNGAIDHGQNGDSAVNDGSNSGDSQSGTASGDTQQSSSGQLQTEGMGDSQTALSNAEPQVYEGVTASEFDDAMQQVHDEISVLNASCLVLVAAVFACFGALCVKTLIDSMHWRE